jgi:hypothetical protein
MGITAVPTRKLLLPTLFATLCFTGSADAAVPQFNASCPQGTEVHADKGGPIYINGTKANLKTFNETYYEASGSGVTISLSINPDGTASVSYTAGGGANGMCQVQSASVQEPDETTASAEVDLNGIGMIIKGGPTEGRLFRGEHGKYALIVNAKKDGFVCTGLMKDPPGTKKTMAMSITCTNGARGNASIIQSRSGTKYSVTFTLNEGNGGYVLLQ